ncbi:MULTISPECIES: hypothetical protein [unclassified Burkholderia]|uniref:hypothetical protein n=1 Tax=unclassified Burkholderia TaxID=2613784 RepID=UPI002AB1ECCA|nr:MULTISPECIES: hypothetical protein [unclassified Burkholderia]
MAEKRDVVVYLNDPKDPSPLMFSRLIREIEQSKQARAPATQWIALIRNMTQKGVKQAEIDETGVLERLNDGDASRVLTRDQVKEFAEEKLTTVKQVTLARPRWASWRWPGGDYAETLFILNSRRDNILDRVESIEFELEQINFDMDRLMEAIPLDEERKRLLTLVDHVPDFTQHHFSSEVDGRLGKNLMAHARYTVRDHIFFIEEVQSDWAQKGRRSEWNGIPKGPYVTNTELWAGLVLRRLLQMAARQPQINEVAWITGDMRNGGRAGGNDGLNDFYGKIIPKLADKVIGKLGKVEPREIILGDQPKTVLGINITDALREKLAGELPLYAHGYALHPAELDGVKLDARAAMVRERFARVIGSAGSLQLCTTLLDDAPDHFGEARLNGATGSYRDRLVSVCLRAEDPISVLNHESFHLAWDRLLSGQEKAVLTHAFVESGSLARRVQELARDHFGETAYEACATSMEERCAYAFQLWASDKLTLDMQASHQFRATQSIFEKIREALQSVWRFVSGERSAKRETPEKIFADLDHGRLAHEHALREAQGRQQEGSTDTEDALRPDDLESAADSYASPAPIG